MSSSITPSRIMKNLSSYYEIQEVEVNEYGIGNTTITWDYTNEKVDKIMVREHCNSLNEKKKSLMWLVKITIMANWKKGETLYILTTQKSDGYFNLFWSKDKKKMPFCDIIIEPDGYASIRTYNNYSTYSNKDEDIHYSFFVRVESQYNDYICDLLRNNIVQDYMK